jgi:hypothetical protein
VEHFLEQRDLDLRHNLPHLVPVYALIQVDPSAEAGLVRLAGVVPEGLP